MLNWQGGGSSKVAERAVLEEIIFEGKNSNWDSKWKIKNEKLVVVEGSVAEDTINKVDSHLVKWSGVEDLLEVLYSRSSLFFDSVAAIT